MSNSRALWRFIDEILAEPGPWRFYGVRIGREVVLAFGIRIEIDVYLYDAGTGRRLSVSFLGEDPSTIRDLSRAGYALDYVGRHTFAMRPLGNDREVRAEMERWEAVARDGQLRHLPTRKQRRLSKQPIAFPTTAIAAVRAFDGWRSAFAGADLRTSAAVLGERSLQILAYAMVSLTPSRPDDLCAGLSVYGSRGRATTKSEVEITTRRMRALLADPKYRRLGANDPRLAPASFFEKKVRSLAELRRERKRLATLLGQNPKR